MNQISIQGRMMSRNEKSMKYMSGRKLEKKKHGKFSIYIKTQKSSKSQGECQRVEGSKTQKNGAESGAADPKAQNLSKTAGAESNRSTVCLCQQRRWRPNTNGTVEQLWGLFRETILLAKHRINQ